MGKTSPLRSGLEAPPRAVLETSSPIGRFWDRRRCAGDHPASRRSATRRRRRGRCGEGDECNGKPWGHRCVATAWAHRGEPFGEWRLWRGAPGRVGDVERKARTRDGGWARAPVNQFRFIASAWWRQVSTSRMRISEIRLIPYGVRLKRHKSPLLSQTPMTASCVIRERNWLSTSR